VSLNAVESRITKAELHAARTSDDHAKEALRELIEVLRDMIKEVQSLKRSFDKAFD
jgi:hypothetical protein